MLGISDSFLYTSHLWKDLLFSIWHSSLPLHAQNWTKVQVPLGVSEASKTVRPNSYIKNASPGVLVFSFRTIFWKTKSASQNDIFSSILAQTGNSLSWSEYRTLTQGRRMQSISFRSTVTSILILFIYLRLRIENGLILTSSQLNSIFFY